MIKMDTGELTGTWTVPGGLQNPHDIAVTEDGNTVYVCELNPFKVWQLTNGAPSTSPLPASLPNSKAASTKSKAAPILPDLHMSSSVLMAAAVSVPLSILIAVCLAVRRCRKRGRGHLGGKEGKRGKEWGVGKLLQGRDREGFKPLDTEERDGMLDDDSDSEVEEFSIPANHA
jgi:peptidylamidoglycolate lyase